MLDPIIVYKLPDHDSAPPPGLEDVWKRLSLTLRVFQRTTQDEGWVRAHQLRMAREGGFYMPSPFHDGTDSCVASFSHNYRFFYRFAGREEYYWATALLARGYCLAAIFFPARNIVVHLFPDADPPELYRTFLSACGAGKRVSGQAAGPVTVVSGFQHPMHVLWNELPALAQAAASPAATALSLAMRYEPFGPTQQLFPEFAGRVHRVSDADIAALNWSGPFMVGLGSRVITASTQSRVRAVAASQVDQETLHARDAFREKHWPIIWLSVKPPKRTIHCQIPTLSQIVAYLCAEFPKAGFLVDGASLPWDYEVDGTYPDWFRDVMTRATTESGALQHELRMTLDPALHLRVVWLNGISICAEIAWGEIATFYFCHGGTMQNKIGWVHRIPGVLHSNKRFMGSYRGMLPPVENAPPCECLPDALIVDDDPSGYSALELARKDQNYRFTSTEQVALSVANTFRKWQA